MRILQLLRLTALSLVACDVVPGIPHDEPGGSGELDPDTYCPVVGDCPKGVGCVAIGGRFLDDAGACRENPSIGCRGKNTPCDAGLTYARDYLGRLWQFPSSCVPWSWPVEPLDAGATDDWSSCKADAEKANQ